jgi:hypothetical protein
MRKIITSAVVGAALAYGVFFAMDVLEGVQTARRLASLQAEAPSAWLSVTDLKVADGVGGQEPSVSWIFEPKRQLELRIAVTTRDVETGEPVCVGGTITFIVEPAPPARFARTLSRIAGVERCEWPVGTYRARFSWSMTDPATRIAKSFVQESAEFRVRP